MAQQTDHVPEVRKMVTAVEWLLEAIGYKQESDKTTTINIHPDCDVSDLVERAKQIEKEQIMNARLSTFDLIRRDDILKAEQYYNETYGTEQSTK